MYGAGPYEQHSHLRADETERASNRQASLLASSTGGTREHSALVHSNADQFFPSTNRARECARRPSPAATLRLEVPERRSCRPEHTAGATTPALWMTRASVRNRGTSSRSPAPTTDQRLPPHRAAAAEMRFRSRRR